MSATAATAAPSTSYRVETIAEGLDRPWSIAFLPDGRALVSESPGRLRLVVDGALQPTPVAGLPSGLYLDKHDGPMDIAVDPRFNENGFIYLSHAYGTDAANNIRVIRARLTGNRVEDVRTLFEALPLKRTRSNAGGRLAFLSDETLLLTIGDAFIQREQAQNPANHLGKTLRLTRDGKAPPDNPFVGKAGTTPEIYTLGHRNAQGITVVDGVAWISEHGARGGDELNRLKSGANYGWPLVTQGVDYTWARVSPFTGLPGMEPPVVNWTPSIAPAGLMHYTGTMFPAWRGDFLVPMLAGKRVQRVRIGADGAVSQEVLFADLDARIRDMRQAPDGALWLLTAGRGARLLRVVPAAP
ncbi:PQQ-dependent sugar dehydrogenase [Pigmentiphaga aceris]|uniref:PQQ-dependent sugar dehydrogenase n=1 Tax=Pigmentiphaga aceris TaxID=1940612 RepID=A0A5C0B644_9BURK|nr:PQQ-dependent sugar dehydrogenase [Pigmentiphaga aceris]QEI08067.1 PQQ-dependent sugar dehydrogenase [Pigmentiphaga aceris]